MKEQSDKPETSFQRPRLVPHRLQNKVFLIPSFVTMVGMFCGFLAIISTFKGNYAYAATAILIAIIVDGLDGRIARSLNATSDFGREFDSLSDLIAFGVAPAVLIFSWGYQTIADEFGILLCFLFVACSATRLARFNIAGSSSKHFVGLPTPAAAAALVSLAYVYPNALNQGYLVYCLMLYQVTISLLMVSTLQFFSVKHLKLTPGNLRLNFFLVAAVVALTWYDSKKIVLLISTAYAISGPFLYLSGVRRKPEILSSIVEEEEIEEEEAKSSVLNY